MPSLASAPLVSPPLVLALLMVPPPVNLSPLIASSIYMLPPPLVCWGRMDHWLRWAWFWSKGAGQLTTTSLFWVSYMWLDLGTHWVAYTRRVT